MSDTDRKIKDILTKANGQVKLTEQAVRTLIERDHKFLLELVTPYLDGIIAHSIDRARKHIETPEASAKKKFVPLPKVKKTMPKPKESAALSTGGMNGLLDAWAKKFEKSEPDEKLAEGKKVSAQHIEAIKALIKKN